MPYLNILSRTIPFLNNLSQTIPYLNTMSGTHPSCAQSRRNVGSQPESSTKKTLHFRQPIRINCYLYRVFSQSKSSITSPESSITSPESSRVVCETLLGSQLLSARYSLSSDIGSPTPPTWSTRTLTTYIFGSNIRREDFNLRYKLQI